jgi:hypothetical protein
MLKKATSDAKTKEDMRVFRNAKAEAKSGGVSQATAQEMGQEGGMERLSGAAKATGTNVPPGAQAAAIGQQDAKHADPDVRAFSRDPVNNPLVNASDAEVSAAVDVPIQSNTQSAGDLTSLPATKDLHAKTVFKGNYVETASSQKSPVASPAENNTPSMAEEVHGGFPSKVPGTIELPDVPSVLVYVQAGITILAKAWAEQERFTPEDKVPIQGKFIMTLGGYDPVESVFSPTGTEWVHTNPGFLGQ